MADGAELRTSPSTAVAPDRAGEIPLSPAQKLRLVLGCVPFIVWALAFHLVATRLEDITGRVPPLLLPFVGLFVLIFGVQAVNRIRDLLSGVALVRGDLLEHTYFSREGRRYYGRFRQLGRMRLMPQAQTEGVQGQRYLVRYSAASKIVWTVQALG